MIYEDYLDYWMKGYFEFIKNNPASDLQITRVLSFALNDERFMKARKSDQEYFKRLLERIKLIRTSVRMFYQKITDIFAENSIGYDKNSDIAIPFYKTIQNKFYYAITGKTAAEIIYNRADAKKIIWDLLLGKIHQMVIY